MNESFYMLLYPTISFIIKQTGKCQFRIYYNPTILVRLQLSSNAFTALGIVATNDYNFNYYNFGSLVPRKFNFYKTITKIQQSNPNMSVKSVLKAFTAETNMEAT